MKRELDPHKTEKFKIVGLLLIYLMQEMKFHYNQTLLSEGAIRRRIRKALWYFEKARSELDELNFELNINASEEGKKVVLGLFYGKDAGRFPNT